MKRLGGSEIWPHGWLRGVLVALGAPGTVTLLAAFDTPVHRATVTVLYVLAVVIASVLGGAAAGVLASVVSFLALNFFFTPPVNTLDVERPEDFAALIVFLVVSVLTGLLLSAVLRQKGRAERREVQTRLLNRFSGEVLSGRVLEDVLRELGDSLVKVLDLASCEFDTVLTGKVSVGITGSTSPEDELVIPLSAKGSQMGSMLVTVAPTRGPLVHEDLTVLDGFARQLALALESIRLSEEVNRMQLEAETERLRSAWFSGVTHDLKTPLAAITASVTSLQESTITGPDRDEHLDTIRQEADHLNRLVSNLLDLGRLRAGVLLPTKQPVAIDELIESVVARLRPFLSGHDVEIDLKGEVPEVALDLVQIEQALTNLIEKAVKFSPDEAGIRISVVGAPGNVRVAVADKGPGIAKADRDRLFQPFERGSGETAGTGLGLAVASALIGAHGGRIWAQETPGGGATLTFELPTEREDEEVRERSSSGR